MTRVARSALSVTVLTAIGMALGFFANLVIAARFGVGAEMDAYLAATTVPSWITLILTTSLAATFVPVYTEYREQNPADAWIVAASLIRLAAWAGIVLALVGMIFAEPIVRWITPGLTAEQIHDAGRLMRWLLPTVALSAINQLLSGVFYAQGKFLAPMALRVLGPLLTLTYVALFSDSLRIESLVLATLSAHLLQTVILVAALSPFRFRETFGFPQWNHRGVRKVLRLTAPLMAAMFFYKLGPLVERWIASGMGIGAISTLGYATRLTAVLQPLLISGIAVSGFAVMAKHVTTRDLQALKEHLAKSSSALFFASIPLAVLLCGFAYPVIELVYQRGAFTAADSSRTAPLFALYALALPAGAVGTVVGQVYYAFQETRLPILAGLADLILFAGLAFILVPYWGLPAIPAAFLIAFYLTSLWIAARLSRRTGFSLWPLFARPFFQSLTASLAGLITGIALQRFLPAMACLCVAGAVYLGLQHFVFRSRETTRIFKFFQP